MAEKKETKKKVTKKETGAEKKKTSPVLVDIEIKGDEWQEALDKTFEKKQKEVKVDGFRKGHVPRDIYEKKFGKESLFLDAADLVLQDAFLKALEQSKVEPVVQPKVDLKEINENGVTFTFSLIAKPEVQISKYTGLKVKKQSTEVTKKEIQEAVDATLDRYSEMVVKDGPVADGDVAVIDFEGFKDGVAFEGGKGENYSLQIGSNTFIPGFEEQLIGMKSEEEKDIQVTFPEDYPHDDLKGKEVTFKVKVHEVKAKEKRKLDKDFFEDLAMPGVDSKESLEEEIKKNIEAHKMEDAENKYVDDILKAVAENVTVDIPDEMISEELDNMVGRFAEQLKMQGISIETYYQFTKMTEGDLRHQMEGEAKEHVLYRLMLEHIAELEHIEISDEDASAEAEDLAKKYQMEKDAFLKAFGGIEMIKYDMQIRKTIDLLKEKNA